MNTKDKRIAKLFRKGLSIEQIARKIGMPSNLERVREGLEREELCRNIKAKI